MFLGFHDFLLNYFDYFVLLFFGFASKDQLFFTLLPELESVVPVVSLSLELTRVLFLIFLVGLLLLCYLLSTEKVFQVNNLLHFLGRLIDRF